MWDKETEKNSTVWKVEKGQKKKKKKKEKEKKKVLNCMKLGY